jgi:nucleoside-diphosphate-sugar epimerase
VDLMPGPATLLVLGAGGFIGGAVTRQAAADGDRVHCLVRRPAPALEPHGTVHIGDARRPQLGLEAADADMLAAETTHLVLTMGAVEFGMTPSDARANHLAPLRSALGFARSCRNLEAVTFVSSIAAIGDCEHRVGSGELPVPRKFRNFYEWAKAEGERLVRSTGLPMRIVRPGQVMNSYDDEHRTPSPLLMFEALPYLAMGLPLATGDHMDYWCGPVDFVASVVLAATRRDDVPHVWAIDPDSPTRAQILDLLALRHGLGGARIKQKRVARAISAVMKPTWLDLDVPREVLGYTHAQFDIDLSCIQKLIEIGAVEAPTDRSYVTRTVDHEVARMGEIR